ncbi:MAG: DUF2726 domain-containing protein [Methylophaga sp.]|nr:DUF2726 domain-containing protein [Methylophaga sp.]
MEFIILIFLVILVGLFLLWSNRRRDKQKQQTIPYIKHPSLLNQNEYLCFKAIKQAVGERYDVHCKVRLSSIIAVDKNINKSLWATASERLSKRKVDFLLTDAENSQIACVIELDDSNPHRSRKPRDVFCREVLSNAKVPYIRLDTMPVYDTEEISELVESLFKPVQNKLSEIESEVNFKILIEPDQTSSSAKR